MKPDHITHAEKAEIIARAKVAAVAMAQFWDVLNAAETDTHEFVGAVEMVNELAAALDSPPDASRIDDELVWEQVVAMWRKS